MISNITEVTEEKRIEEWVDTIRRDIPVDCHGKNQGLYKVLEECRLDIHRNTLLVYSRLVELDEQ